MTPQRSGREEQLVGCEEGGMDQAHLLARTIPRARKVVLPRVAHVLNMERPAEINRLILDFLGEQYPST